MHKSINLCDGLSSAYLQEIENFIAEWESSDDFISVKTSGSTSKPKLIRLKKDNVRESALATGKFFDFQPGQRLLLNLSPSYIAGKLMIVRALVHEMHIVVAPLDQNPLLHLTFDNIDFAAFVPYQIKAILEHKQSTERYGNIRNVIIGGAPLPSEYATQLQQLSNQSYVTFGMTETITHFALQNLTRNESFFTCLPGFKIEQDDRGCLVICENKVSDRLVTNDLIELINATQFKWLGRLDFVINSGGIKISPEWIESKIEAIIQGQAYYIHGRKSDIFGEEIVLYIEGEEVEGLDTKLAALLTKFERPKAIIYKPDLERTETGKIIRKNYR